MNALTNLRTLELPARMRRLPKDGRGYAVPMFVRYIDGKPDFRIVNTAFMQACIRLKRCWICGEPLGRMMAFAIGPMCTVDRISAEPPSHYDCARYAVRVCPFMANPGHHRQSHNMPPGHKTTGGDMILRNPGIAVLWITRAYKALKVDNGIVFQIGEPERVEWYREARAATDAEIIDSFRSGLPILREVAERQGPEAVAALPGYLAAAVRWTPAGRLPADITSIVHAAAA